MRINNSENFIIKQKDFQPKNYNLKTNSNLAFGNTNVLNYNVQDVFVSQQTKKEKTPQADLIFFTLQDKILSKFYPEKFILKYSNPRYLEKSVNNNPLITHLLKPKGIDAKIEPQNVNSIIHSHLIPTAKYAVGILKNSNEHYSQKEYDSLYQAGLLHDIGKSLIPSEILNKKGKLNTEEKEVVDLHNRLGYELIKSSPLDKDTKYLILHHHSHNNLESDNNFVQMLKVADIYSALKEDRPYKKPMDDKKAFEILEETANSGEFDIKYVESLKRFLSTQKKNA